MTRAWLTASFAAAFIATSVAACDSSDDPSPVTSGDAGSDAAAPDGDADLPIEDAADAADAADAKTASEVCTADDLCHTALPPGQTLRGVWGDPQGVVWAVSEQGNILRWDGESWEIHHSNAGALFAIWGSSPTNIWVGGRLGLLHGHGASSKDLVWTPVTVPGLDGVPIYAIAGRSATDIWAVGGRADLMTFPPPIEGRVLHFTGPSSDPGGGWAVTSDAPDHTVLTSVWTAGEHELWIGGTNFENYPVQLSRGVLRHREAGAGTFADVTLPTVAGPGGPSDIEMITGGAVIDGDVIALGVSMSWGTYLRGSRVADGGTSLAWEDRTFDVHPSHLHHAVWGSSSNDVWLAGDYGRLRHWDGTSWSLPRIAVGKAPVTSTFHAVWASAADDLWFVGDRIALHKRPSKK